jgi:hypothetical protein
MPHVRPTPQYQRDARLAWPRTAPSGLAILNLIPNPGRCPGLSPDTPLGLKTTSEVDLRFRPDVATRRQTVGVFLTTPTAWQRMATIAPGGYDRAIDCFERGIGLSPQRGIM